MKKFWTVFSVATTFCLVTCVAVFGRIPPSGGACTQGCHTDQYWKWSNECFKLAEVNACDNAWAVSVGGTLTAVGGSVSYEKYSGNTCFERCTGVGDSIAWPFSSLGATDRHRRISLLYMHGVDLQWTNVFVRSSHFSGGVLVFPKHRRFS